MARSMWSGSISFGLVQIPVGVVTAEKSSEKSLSFTLLDKRDMSPIGYRQVNKNTGEEVDKGRHHQSVQKKKGEYIPIEPEELEAVAIESKHRIEIDEFVPHEEIDELMCQTRITSCLTECRHAGLRRHPG